MQLGHDIRFKVVLYCGAAELNKKEAKAIECFKPPLNSALPKIKTKSIQDYTLEKMFDETHIMWDDMFGFIKKD